MRRFAILLAVCLPVLADDHLVLRNGSDVSGTILRDREEMLTFRIANPPGEMVFPYKDILAINGVAAEEILRVRRLVDTLAAGIERRTGLGFGGPVSRLIRTPEQLEQDLQAEAKESIPAGSLVNRGLALRYLGLTSAEFDYEARMAEMHVAFSRAHFDRAKMNLWLVVDRRGAAPRSNEPDWGPEWFLAGVGSSEEEFDVLHELMHDAASQVVPFDAVDKACAANMDAALAFDALWEGAADLLALETIFERAGLDAARVPDARSAVAHASHLNALVSLGAPAPYRKMLFFARDHGVPFLSTARSLEGWKVIRRALSDPPTSTQQVLHPEKYFCGREVPIDVRLPHPLLGVGSWDPIDENTLGEFGTSVLLSAGGDPEAARKAAEGWGGDRYAVFRSKEGNLGLAWLSAWDSEEAAKAFANLAAKWLETRHGGAGLVPTEDLLQGSEKGVTFFVEQKKERVLVCDGFPSEYRDAFRKGLWTSVVERPAGGGIAWIAPAEWKAAPPQGRALAELIQVESPAAPSGQMGAKGFECPAQGFTLASQGEWQLSMPDDDARKRGVFLRGRVHLEPASVELSVDAIAKGAAGQLVFAAACRDAYARVKETKEQVVSRAVTKVLGNPALVLVTQPNELVDGKVYKVKRVIVAAGSRALRFRFTAPDEEFTALEPHLDRLLEGLALQ